MAQIVKREYYVCDDCDLIIVTADTEGADEEVERHKTYCD